ncbi:MAG: chromosomal replication initiator protein DnaA [Butyricicoccus sp.]|nr:chromosomal replication initiator protein DnaA [Butyricicoccus sp.]
MNSVDDIWKSIIEILSAQLTPTSIKTWFSDCTPLELNDGRLVLHTSSDFKRDVLTQRFAGQIKTVLSDLFSCDFELMILAGEDELEEYAHNKKNSSILPEMDGYTFENFIVGKSNQYAHAAAVGVVTSPGSRKYNPLFIYGRSGLGKTHLLLAIGSAIHEKDAGAKIVYIKGDEFTNQMIKSIKDGTAEAFRQKYRNVDLFLVDDIQFIAGKESTQEEFFHTFNNIYEAGHQIVITSDRPPIDMLTLDDRLRTRFEGGLMADVQPPDLETRMAIIRNKAGQLGMRLSNDVVQFIASNVTSNIRQIEGVVKRLTAYRDLDERDITVESVRRAIKDVIRIGAYIPSPEVIINECARYFSVTPEDIRGQKRTKNIANARHISIYLVRTLTNLSLNDIGTCFEDRNHTTVLASINKIEALMKVDNGVAATIRDITSNINSRQ